MVIQKTLLDVDITDVLNNTFISNNLVLEAYMHFFILELVYANQAPRFTTSGKVPVRIYKIKSKIKLSLNLDSF